MIRLLLASLTIIVVLFNTVSTPYCLADDADKNDSADNAKTEQAAAEEEKSPEELKAFETKCSLVDPLALVENPEKYMDQYVLLKGQFDKYTTLGLDYEPAMRESKDYITFLIRRPGGKGKKHIIPLSELKLIIARKTAEKYTGLETGDEIIIYGKVFSTALNDPWVDVDHLVSTTKDLKKPIKEENGADSDDEE